jgi:uncharacterized protein YjbI with pentapeptide repeats
MTNAKLAGANVDGADFTNANLNAVDLSATVNLDRAIGLDRARYYKPRAPKNPPPEPSQAGSPKCLEDPAFANPPPPPVAAQVTG